MNTLADRQLDECRRLAQLVQGWRAPLILTHARADGDAIGCLAAMKAIMQTWGAMPTGLTFEPVSTRYRFLADPTDLSRWPDSGGPTPEPDGVIILDTCAYNQIDPAAAWLRSTPIPKVVIDHHLTRDVQADGYLIDPSAAAACLLVWEWAGAVGWTVPPEAQNAIFVGLATDTGWFHHSNTDARAMSAAAELLNGPVNANEMYDRLYMQEPARRMRLLSAMLDTLQLSPISPPRPAIDAGGEPFQVATLCITQAMMRQCEAVPGDTEDLVNEPMRIATVAASILFYEQSDGIVRVGLRSKAVWPHSPMPDLDMSEVAAALGGGGHRHAAGVRISGRLDDVRAQVLAVVQAAAEPASPSREPNAP